MENSRPQNLHIEMKLFLPSIFIRSLIICHLKFIEKATRNFNYGFPVMSKGLFAAFITVIGNVSGLNFSLERTRFKLILLTIETVF